MPLRRVAQSFFLGGDLADHPDAEPFAREAFDLIHRYATEVVAAHRLCPFLHNVDHGLGSVCLMLTRETQVDQAVDAIQVTGASVVHVVYPLLPRTPVDASTTPAAKPGSSGPTSSSRFERFGNAVAEGLRKVRADALVHATFHPELVGGTENPHRMVGLLRRSPDPFIQFIPPGMHEGGTVIAGAEPPSVSPLEDTYARMVTGGVMSELDTRFRELHEKRLARDARYHDAFFTS